MAESHVVSGLVTKRSEVAGLVDHHQKELQRLSTDLEHLDAAIRIFAPSMNLRSLRPIKRRMRNHHFRPGECQRLTLDVLRDENRVLTSRQIAVAIIARKGLNETMTLTELVRKTVLGSLKGLEARRTVIQGTPNGMARTWRIT